MAAKEKMEELMIVNRRTGKALQTTGLDGIVRACSGLVLGWLLAAV